MHRTPCDDTCDRPVEAGKTNQPNNSIVINATGNALSGATASAFYAAPIRNATQASFMYYNPTSKEVNYYGAAIGGGYNGYYTAPWATAFPSTTTSGVAFNIPITGVYSITTNASGFSATATSLITIRIWINGVNTGQDMKVFTNEATSHKTLIPLVFQYTLNAGTNYLYYQQTSGSSDNNDFGSFSWVYSPF